jgi:hypothetical protein
MLSRLTAVLCFCSLFLTAGAYAGLHPLGLTLGDLDKVAPEHEAKAVAVAPGAKSFRDMPRVDLTDEMPPAGNQGGQGSCAAWAITYYHRTQLEFHERHWDLTDPHHQFSPAFTYNQVNGGGDNGSSFENNMPLICESGVASLADCPYDDRDCTTWPSESAYARAIPFRTKDWAWFHTNDTTGINNIRQLLANGSTSCLAIWVWGNFDAINAYDTTYCASDKIGSNRGGHLVTFVGYDDTLTTHDGVGAFRMVNSWGAGWGDHAYFWMSYEAVMDHDLSQRAVGYLTDTVGYEPKLVARVKIDHPTRDRVGLEFSVGPRNNSLWIKYFRQWRDARTDQPFPDHNLVFDLTDAASFITGGQTDSVYFCAWDSRRDGLDGTIENAAAQMLDWGTIMRSSAVPLEIPDNGNTVLAGIRLFELDRDVTATCVFGPQGIVGPDSSYVPLVEVRNWGTAPATFPAYLSIAGGYSDTVQVSGLAEGQADTLAFDAWTVPPRCTALVFCRTALTGDEYPDNDSCSVTAWARYRDVALLEITAPADTVDSGAVVRPQVRVRNNGTQLENVMATFSIPAESYQRVTRTSVPMGEEVAVTFATWIPKVFGTHTLTCTLALAGDADPTNDTASGSVTVQAAGVAEGRQTPVVFGLGQPRPSVFSASTEFAFGLPRAGSASLAIYDATGARVRQLVTGRSESGSHRRTWDGRDEQGREVASGAYFVRLIAGDRRATAVLLKL